MTNTRPSSQDELRTTLLKLNARAWGIALGLLLGLGLAIATIVLVMRGGAAVGLQHSLHALILPAYTVSVGGAFIFFPYLLVIGYAIGRLIGLVYNKLARSG